MKVTPSMIDKAESEERRRLWDYLMNNPVEVTVPKAKKYKPPEPGDKAWEERFKESIESDSTETRRRVSSKKEPPPEVHPQWFLDELKKRGFDKLPLWRQGHFPSVMDILDALDMEFVSVTLMCTVHHRSGVHLWSWMVEYKGKEIARGTQSERRRADVYYHAILDAFACLPEKKELPF